jgi:hypothetical protein
VFISRTMVANTSFTLILSLADASMKGQSHCSANAVPVGWQFERSFSLDFVFHFVDYYWEGVIGIYDVVNVNVSYSLIDDQIFVLRFDGCFQFRLLKFQISLKFFTKFY